MVVRCPSCQSAYRLDERQLPETGVRVRCPRCTHVFKLRREPSRDTVRPVASVSEMAAGAPVSGPDQGLPGFERDLRQPPRLRPREERAGRSAAARGHESPGPARPAWNVDSGRTLQLGGTARQPSPESPRLETPPFRPGSAATSRPGGTAAPAAPTAPAAPGGEPSGARAHERARRLARVLVSDILVYNQETRDRALREGNLLSALGVEINKAWELYKSKVSPDVVGSTTYFKEALNEILAEGEKIF